MSPSRAPRTTPCTAHPARPAAPAHRSNPVDPVRPVLLSLPLLVLLAAAGCAPLLRGGRGAPATALTDSARFERLVARIEPRGRRAREGDRDPLARLRPGADSLAAVRATARLAELRSIDTTRLGVPQRIDWLLLESSLRRTVYDTVLHAAARMPARYLTLGDLYFQVMGDRPPRPEDWAAARRALERAPEAMALGRQQLRAPPPLWVRLAVNTGTSYGRFLRGEFAERVRSAAPDSLRAPLLAAGERAAAALDAYTTFLRDTLQPGAAGSWAAGMEYYDWVLRNVDFLAYDADSMIADGRRIHAATRRALDSLASARGGGSSWQALAEDLRTRHPAPGRIVAAYEAASHRVQGFLVSENLVWLPPCQELVFVPTPPELRETYAWGGYGGLTRRDSVNVGRFFVTDVVPGMTPEAVREKLRAQNDGWISVIALHEGYPGHHLQAAYAARSTRRLRRDAGNTYAAEGWALFSEHWLARRGLFATNPDGALAQLQMRLWRTARVIIDPSLHTGRMTYDDAVSFFVREVGLERSAAEAEVNRFTTWPTQAPSYIIGWLEIQRLEDELRSRLGSRFDEKTFVERALAQGALPLALLRRAVLDSYGLPDR